VAKKKKKGKKKKKKKKQDKKEVNQPTMNVSVRCVEETSNMHRKPKYPCRLCKGDHFLINCPNIPKVLEVWSEKYHQLSIDPSTSDSQVPGKRVKLGFLVSYTKGVIKITFSLTWRKPQNCWKTLSFHSKNFQLVTVGFYPTYRQLTK